MIRLLALKTIITLVCLLPLTAFGADIYWVSNIGAANWVSAESDTALNGTACTDILTAMDSAVAGDTVNLRAGTYSVPASPDKCNGSGLTSVYTPTNSGTIGNPITFKSYNSEVVYFDNSANTGVGCTLAIYGTWGNDYIVFSGLDTKSAVNYQGRCVTINISDNITVQNSELEGVTTEDNNACVRIDGSSNITIYNNKMWNVYGIADTTNPSAIELYGSYNVIIDHNDLVDCQNGIYVKNDIQNADITYNYINNIANAGVRINPKWPYMDEIDVSHNIIVAGAGIGDSSQSGDEAGYLDNFSYNNNTIYVTADGIKTDPGGPNSDYRNGEIYNNIIYNIGATQYYLRLSNITVSATVDYNHFYDSDRFVEIATTYASLIAWQAGSGYDANSVEENPNFLNTGGSFELRTDFKRSSYPADGRGGIYEDVMGAYVTGNETIGYTANPQTKAHGKPGNSVKLTPGS